jgi:hypothetical protein
MWPKIEQEIVAHGGHDAALAFPGMHDSGLAESLAHLDAASRRQATDAAFAHLWANAQPSPAPAKLKRRARKPAAGKVAKKPTGTIAASSSLSLLASPAASMSTGVSGEFNSLIPLVRQNVDGGLGGWSNVRLRMFRAFGAAADPGVAIPRINAYYGQLVPADFPPAPSSTRP